MRSALLHQCQLKTHKTGWRHRFRDSEGELAPAVVSHDCCQNYTASAPSRRGRNEAPSTTRLRRSHKLKLRAVRETLSLRLDAGEQMHAARRPPRDG